MNVRNPHPFPLPACDRLVSDADDRALDVRNGRVWKVTVLSGKGGGFTHGLTHRRRDALILRKQLSTPGRVVALTRITTYKETT